jgi:hypothetical protein
VLLLPIHVTSAQGVFTCNSSFDEFSACRTTMQLLLSSNPLTENKTFVGLQSFKLLHGMGLFSEILSGGSPSLTQGYQVNFKFLIFWVITYNPCNFGNLVNLSSGHFSIIIQHQAIVFFLEIFYHQTSKSICILFDKSVVYFWGAVMVVIVG